MNDNDGSTDSANDQVLASAPAYQTSAFGDYYLATGSPLYNADKRGSRSPVDAGLYHYTTRTDQMKNGAQTGSIIGGKATEDVEHAKIIRWFRRGDEIFISRERARQLLDEIDHYVTQLCGIQPEEKQRG